VSGRGHGSSVLHAFLADVTRSPAEDGPDPHGSSHWAPAISDPKKQGATKGPSSGGGSCTIEGIEGIAFDLSGTLWGSLSARGAAGSPGLYAIDTSTGAATFLDPIVHAGGAAPSGGVVSLQFGCDGTLYAERPRLSAKQAMVEGSSRSIRVPARSPSWGE
jgi:hypothetical protein